MMDNFGQDILNQINKKEQEIVALKKDYATYLELRKKYSMLDFGSEAIIPRNLDEAMKAKRAGKYQSYRKKGKPVIPTIYDANKLTWDEKCLYTLKQIGSARTDEVIDYIANLEPTLDKNTTIKNAVTNKLSKMKIAEWIYGKQTGEGKKVKYSLDEL